jgi:hypothetical protein
VHRVLTQEPLRASWIFPNGALPFATQNSEGSRDPARAILRCTATATLGGVSLADEAALTSSSAAMGD